jgi:hypothetical protein
MNKRLEKRHKRAVARAREHVKVSEPDLRTPEQIQEDRAASKAGWSAGSSGKTGSAAPAFLNSGHAAGTGSGSAAKTSV